MIDDDDIEGLAGEYVLGSLSPSERAAVQARRPHDHALDEAIKGWERRLGPLSDRLREIAPPAGLYDTVLSHINAKPAVRPLQSYGRHSTTARRPWLTAAAVALAACLLLMVGWVAYHKSSSEAILFAQLHGVGGAASVSEVPAFAAVIDATARTLTIRPIDVRPIAEKKYALWLVQQATAPPISLGTVSADQPATLTWFMNPQIDEFVNFTVAISLEPAGGDTGPVPSGPYAFAGKLVGPDGSGG